MEISRPIYNISWGDPLGLAISFAYIRLSLAGRGLGSLVSRVARWRISPPIPKRFRGGDISDRGYFWISAALLAGCDCSRVTALVSFTLSANGDAKLGPPPAHSVCRLREMRRRILGPSLSFYRVESVGALSASSQVHISDGRPGIRNPRRAELPTRTHLSVI